ncbi:hypothetical protein PYCCODRAFT_1458859 [Trametes coccinea BRFM310]|uniref:Casein kinase substrate phosphoprotein PP28 domain-containing protein n=1 Tax=Trametes coccinea (strain BRFM310) TaxID=1353009 RepID=A0A1Y2INR4_TRAC3|nr:hypothetical protein PYCCODRAFT_1458859 [Trametes coccinea BRFM310]
MSDNQSADQAASNSLGLDLEALKIKDSTDAPADPPASASTKDAASPAEGSGKPADEASDAKQGDNEQSPDASKKEPKKKPYVNPDRVKTGGAQRDKLSEEELAERMARIREQNEKIKQRRLDVQADEEEYKKTQAAERAKLAKMKKVQENVDKAREQNARRKMDKIQAREWDSGKPTRDWKQPKKAGEETAEDGDKKPAQSIGIRGAVRGGGRGGGRGRGRGGGVTSPTAEKTEQAAAPAPAVAETPAPAETAAASS